MRLSAACLMRSLGRRVISCGFAGCHIRVTSVQLLAKMVSNWLQPGADVRVIRGSEQVLLLDAGPRTSIALTSSTRYRLPGSREGALSTRRHTPSYSFVFGLALTAGCSSYSATVNLMVPDKDAGGSDAGDETGGRAGTGALTSTGGATLAGGSSNGGGSSATGGVAGASGGSTRATGGSVSSAGSSAPGGASATGGTSTTGGVVSIGGASTTGGSTGVAGSAATGGASISSGTAVTGGAVSTGGAPVAGGSSGTGGTTGSGGASSAGGGAVTGGSSSGTGGASCTTTVTPATPTSPFESTWQSCSGSTATLVSRTLKRPAPSLHVARGDSHTCIGTNSGTVRCWGANFTGQLGYGNTDNIGDNELPKSAGDVAVGGAVVQITAEADHTCALLNGGTVRCWGSAGAGALGYGPANTNNIGDNELPKDVGDVNVGGSVVQVACGGGETCALLEGGTVRCWGSSSNGQLGYGNTNSVGVVQTPADAGDVPIGGSVLQISTGGGHTCALMVTGAVRCWGWNSFGQLGYGHTSSIGDNETPASAGDVNLGGKAVQISAGGIHTCALLESGIVRCWGSGSSGQLGYASTGNVGDVGVPASAGDVNVGGKVTQVVAGQYNTCALLESGSVRCWGSGMYGALGYGNTTNIGDNEVPADAGDVPVGGPVAQISTSGGPSGIESTCAFLRSGSLRCWGANTLGQLGYGNTTNVGDTATNTPAAVGNVQFQ
jgi:alpha-tubulin suppressor-like RCC1 family protein